MNMFMYHKLGMETINCSLRQNSIIHDDVSLIDGINFRLNQDNLTNEFMTSKRKD